MLKGKRKAIIISVLIFSGSIAAGAWLRSVNISQETYLAIARNPIFIAVSLLPLAGCLVMGYLIGKKYYNYKGEKEL